MSRKKTSPDFAPPDSKTIGGRLKIFINDKNMLAAHLATETGVHPSTVGSYLKNESTPKKGFLEKLSEKFNLNPAWVEYGVGPMYQACAQSCSPALHEPAATDYEQECLRLKHELADKDRELAAIELAMGRQQGRIFEAVVVTCRRLGMPPDQTRILQLAVMDYETILAEADGHESRQAAAGNS